MIQLAIVATRRLDAPRRERLRQEQLAGIRDGLESGKLREYWLDKLRRFNVECEENSDDG